MIGITGYMSGGKSYFAVEHMLGQMYRGHRVVTNIQLQCRAVTDYLDLPCVIWKRLYYYLEEKPSGYHHLPLHDYEAYPNGSPRGSATYDRDMVYCYLDEASSIFDSMVHASDGGIRAVATWARHTEKRGIKIFLIMQFASELHKRLRVHITEYVACTNSGTIRLPLVGWGLPAPLRRMTIRSRYMSDGETQIGRAQWFVLRPIIYRCYRTSQIVVGSSDVPAFVPPNIDTTARVVAHQRRFIVVLFVLYGLISFGCWLWLIVCLG